METIWFGIKLGIGIAVGLVVFAYAASRVRGYFVVRKFVKAGFTWEDNANVRGWLSRDPNNDDWILWDEAHGVMLRSGDDDVQWRTTNESLDTCLELGHQYVREVVNRKT